ncbi:unnamed protein product, partial [Rotaria magnacalcarata]
HRYKTKKASKEKPGTNCSDSGDEQQQPLSNLHHHHPQQQQQQQQQQQMQSNMFQPQVPIPGQTHQRLHHGHHLHHHLLKH